MSFQGGSTEHRPRVRQVLGLEQELLTLFDLVEAMMPSPPPPKKKKTKQKKKVFYHCAQTLRRRKLKLGDF